LSASAADGLDEGVLMLSISISSWSLVFLLFLAVEFRSSKEPMNYRILALSIKKSEQTDNHEEFSTK
jgi:hypothetical protein